MNIVCPYTNLQRATEFALRVEEPNTRFCYTGAKDTDYYDLVKELWAARATVIIVEHDIVPWPGALKEMWDCPFQFCAFQAPSGPRSKGLGCLKYGKELMESFPDHINNIEFDRRSWRILDGGLTWNLLNHGVSPHYHSPMVGHHNPDRFNFENMLTEK